MIRDQPPTATAGLAADYAPYTDEPLPPVGGRSVLLGVDEEPLAVLENALQSDPASGRP